MPLQLSLSGFPGITLMVARHRYCGPHVFLLVVFVSNNAVEELLIQDCKTIGVFAREGRWGALQYILPLRQGHLWAHIRLLRAVPFWGSENTRDGASTVSPGSTHPCPAVPREKGSPYLLSEPLYFQLLFTISQPPNIHLLVQLLVHFPTGAEGSL